VPVKFGTDSLPYASYVIRQRLVGGVGRVLTRNCQIRPLSCYHVYRSSHNGSPQRTLFERRL